MKNLPGSAANENDMAGPFRTHTRKHCAQNPKWAIVIDLHLGTNLLLAIRKESMSSLGQ